MRRIMTVVEKMRLKINQLKTKYMMLEATDKKKNGTVIV